MIKGFVKKLKKKLAPKGKKVKTKAPKKKKPLKKRSSAQKSPIRRKTLSAKKPKLRVKKAKKAIAPIVPGLLASDLFFGEVTHYFPKACAAVLTLKRSELKIGDNIKIIGHTTNLKQEITSIQIDRNPIQVAKKGDEIGLGVISRVRRGDKIYKVKA